MKLLQYLFSIFCIITMISCDAINGNKDLGDNFYLFGGDHNDQEILIYCSSYHDGTCSGGTPLIPSSGDTGLLYVSKVNFDENSIIAETTNPEKEKAYWIVAKKLFENYKNCDVVNCDSIIKTNVLGPIFQRRLFKRKETPELFT